ncbi:MAG TPA: LCP family protein [Candidatus Atribacteria bacterium]|nr:LCP family protein [Candidatus Atribacteria bacterium]HQE24482.1 LCP family protein [Candidatus Atribacteria bacterium]
MKNKGRGWKIFYIILGFFLGLFLLFLSTLLGFRIPLRWTIIKEVMGYSQPQNTFILVVGQDSIEPRRSDTIILVGINSQIDEILLFFVPRDSRLLVPGRGYDKVNHSYAQGGIGLLRQTLEGALGIKIPYFVEVDYEGFEKVIDALGGVEIEVEKPLKYVDKAQDLYIDIPAGKQWLDGERALQYVRFRYDQLGDIGRIKRQQNFLQALLDKVDNDSLLVTRLPQLIESTREALSTNLTGDYLKQLVMWFQGLNDRIIRMETMPGEPTYINGVSYWEPDLEASREIVQKFFFARREDIENSREDSVSQESSRK